ncbi:hypothetical protein Taro_047516 [Colocasia esculenta]|uniref:Uncharacterized protein n=1 Tax=Colocasia esculenta TaxID=4460 RepID=A0A843WT54_COLES|nr:hypothetical protein [Colocasia esculenta]
MGLQLCGLQVCPVIDIVVIVVVIGLRGGVEVELCSVGVVWRRIWIWSLNGHKYLGPLQGWFCLWDLDLVEAYEASGMVRGGKPGGDTWGTRWAGRRHMARVHKDWQTGFPYKCMGDQLQSHRKGGDLPVGFLQGEKSSSEEVANEAQQYNGFNLILADVSSQTMVYLTNRPKDGPVTVERSQRLAESFKDLLHKYKSKDVPAKKMVQQLMRDTVKAGRDFLPRTGCDPDWEMELSPVFVQGCYGTRSTVVLSAKANGEVSFYEEYLEMDVWKEHMVQCQIRR